MTEAQQCGSIHRSVGSFSPLIPSRDDSRSQFFSNAWLQYMNLLVKNERFIIEGKKDFVRSTFIELLHNQIDVSNKLFMIISQSDDENFNNYKSFIRETIFPSKPVNPTSLSTIDQSRTDDINASQNQNNSKISSASQNMLAVTQSNYNRHTSNEEKELMLKPSLAALGEQEQINTDNNRLDLSEELSVSDHGSVFRDVQFLNFEPRKSPTNFYGTANASLTNLDELVLVRDDQHENEVLMASQSQNNIFY